MEKNKMYELKKKSEEVAFQSYPKKVIDRICEIANISKESKILNVGKNSEEIARVFIDRKNQVICAKQVEDLRDDDFDYITISGTNNSKDKSLVDNCKRMLKKKGKIIFINNIPNYLTPIFLEISRLNYKFYNKQINYNKEEIDLDIISKVLDKRSIELFSVENNYNLTKEQFIEMIISNSIFNEIDKETYIDYLKQLKIIFEKYKVDNRILIKNKTWSYIGK